MCGIAGIVEMDGAGEDLRSALALMQRALRHRGPDDSGLFLSSAADRVFPSPPRPGRYPSPLWGEGDQRSDEVRRTNLQPARGEVSISSSTGSLCGFAHTRLSILDLSAAGHQPMSTPDARFTITFNGKIYNYRALRAQLEQLGETFHTGTDTEVILHLYARYGGACVEHLRGMFAFAIWDNLEGRCFLARDPLGIKPLYFTTTGGSLIFASEVRALLESGLIARRVSSSALFGYFMFGSVPEPLTLVEGVECLPAGHCLEWVQGSSSLRQYWKVDFGRDEKTPDHPVAHARAALLESLQRHFVSDVPVGIFLSGGIDSTTLLALAARELGQKAKTFCISFDHETLNEGEVAARTAAHFGAEHHDWRLGAAQAQGLLREFMNAADQPSIDGFNTFCVSRHAREHGMKVVLSGLGGDELFCGYPSFRTVPGLLHWGRPVALAGAFSRAAGSLLEQRARSPRWRRFGHFLQNPSSTGAAYWSVRGIFTPDEAMSLTHSYLGANCSIIPQPLEFLGVDPQPSVADEVSLLELTRYMRNQLLRDSDVMSMASGLELRVPFVDRSLVDALSSIPAAQRLQPGKRLLLDALPEIPDWVANRPKRGFVFPFEQWLQEEWAEWFHAVDARSPVPLFSWYRRWSLLALENFLRTNRIECPGLPGER